MDRSEAIEILVNHLADTASEDEDVTEDSAVDYAYEVVDMLEDDDDNEVSEAIRALAN